MGRNKRIEIHDFYCPICGQKNIPLARNVGFKKGELHRKKLYCWHCKTEVNCMEITSYDDLEKFKENFANGEYKQEVLESLEYIQASYA